MCGAVWGVALCCGVVGGVACGVVLCACGGGGVVFYGVAVCAMLCVCV